MLSILSIGIQVKYGNSSAASTATTSTNTTTTEQQPDFDLSKEFMTTKAQLLALVNRLEHVEKELMMRKYI